MTEPTSIHVTSHVSRDFLQNAAYFNTLPKIVWEYVSNSLDNAQEDVPAIVVVEITSNYLTVADNGRGMSRDELRNFFQMHAENIQRKRGKRVRGRFGTGKSAAFGLANQLRIDTTRQGRRNVVELLREDLEAAKSGDPVPVRDVVVNQHVTEENGTKIEVRQFNIRRPDVDQVIAYVERHLSRYRQRARVIINGHECKFEEVPYVEKMEISPPDEVAQHIGDVRLIIKVSAVPLDDEANGIDVLSYGIWHQSTLAGIEKRERANYLFGEVDVPMLEDGDWPIPAFDNTRNNTLNMQNPVVAVLLGWIYQELEHVRLSLVEKDKQRRRSEEAKQLEREAKRIADILNDDFSQLELELELARRVSRRSGGKSVNEILDELGEPWPGDGETPTPWQETGHQLEKQHRGSELAGPGDTPRPGPTAQPGEQLGAKKSVTDGPKKHRQAAFSIDYENATAESSRSRYDRNTKTIFINLDHAQIANAFETGGRRIDSKAFREICYEVAAVEYALAIPFEKLERDELYDAGEALYDVRAIINRVTNKLVAAL